MKAEASVAASLTLLAMCIEKTRTPELLQSYVEEVCSDYLDPLFKLLSSTKHTFPGGTAARVIICNSAVELLKKIAEKLGRSRSQEVIMDTLQCFFECFSTAHGKQSVTALPFPSEEHFGQSEERATTGGGSLAAGRESEVAAEDRLPPLQPVDSDARRQVMATFSKAIVHEAYVDFCKLVGQIKLSEHLHNLDVIEELHASFSQKKEAHSTGFCSLLTLTQAEKGSCASDSDSSTTTSSAESDSDMITNLDHAYMMRPPIGLGGKDISVYGRSSFFVNLHADDATTGATFHQSSLPGTTYLPSSSSSSSSFSAGPRSSGAGNLPSAGQKSSALSDLSGVHVSGTHESSSDVSGRGFFDGMFGSTASPPVLDRVQFYEYGYVQVTDRQTDRQTGGQKI